MTASSLNQGGNMSARPNSQRQQTSYMSRRQNRNSRPYATGSLPKPETTSTNQRMNNTGANFGTILNFKREVGINEGARDIRKWTGVPQVERKKQFSNPRPSEGSPHSKFIQEHKRASVQPNI